MLECRTWGWCRNCSMKLYVARNTYEQNAVRACSQNNCCHSQVPYLLYYWYYVIRVDSTTVCLVCSSHARCINMQYLRAYAEWAKLRAFAGGMALIIGFNIREDTSRRSRCVHTDCDCSYACFVLFYRTVVCAHVHVCAMGAYVSMVCV